MSSRFLVSSNKSAKVLLYQKKNQGWSCLKLRQISHSSINPQQQQQQPEASSPPPPHPQPSSGGSTGLKVFTFALTGFTLGLGYVYFNPDSREKLSRSVPQADVLFDSLDKALGRTAKPADNKVSVVKKADDFQAPPKPLFETKQSEKKAEAPKQVVKEVKKEEPLPVKAVETPVTVVKAPPPEPVVEEPVVVVAAAAAAEPVKPTDWKDSITKFELQEEASIQEFENKLDSLERNLKRNAAASVKGVEAAIQSLNKYRQSLRDALDETKNEASKEAQWKNVTDLFEKQTQFVNEAKQTLASGSKSLEELETLIQSARKSDSFKNLKSLRRTQKEFIEQQRLIKSEESKLKEALIHANVLRTYTNEQKAARSQFLKEIQALQPEGINRENKGDQLSTEEINGLLIHAHKRVLQLQNQIEKMQTSQNKQIQAALEDQQSQYAALQQQNNESMRQLCQQEFNLEKDKLLEAEKLRTNKAIVKELASQAAAHNNHLAQMLKLQHDELVTFYDRKLAAEKEKIRADFFNRVAGTIGKVTGIENALQRRVNLELQANNAQQLWLAVQNLHEILGTSTAETSSEVATIKSNIEAIKVSAPENEFVQKLVNSVPEKALTSGVWTEPDLKERFQNVKDICKKVALIDERGGSLFKYFLSYVQSFFIVECKFDHAKLEGPNGTPKLDEVELNTFNILNLADYYVENGQFDLAIKLMRQLKGEPARLARDWVNDATVLLEIKQACQLLTSYISSIYIGTHLK